MNEEVKGRGGGEEESRGIKRRRRRKFKGEMGNGE